MKRILGLIVLVALVVIIPTKVNAASWGLNFERTEPDEQGYFTVTVKGFQTDNPDGLGVEPIKTTMTLTNVELIGEIEDNGEWTSTREGNVIQFVAGSIVRDAEFTLAKINFKKIDTALEECNVVFECNGVVKTVTPPKKTVKNPKTGNALPYAVILAGTVLTVGVYYVTRSNTKLYKI